MTQKRFAVAAGLTALLVAGQVLVGAQSSRTMEMQLKAAEYKADVQGDVKGALEEYRRIAEGLDPALAAKALLAMAELHHRFGTGDAAAVLARIVSTYSNQPAAAEARSKLAAAPRVTQTGAGARISRELVVAYDFSGAIAGDLSSDGRLMAFVDWRSGHEGNIGVTNRATGDYTALSEGGGETSSVTLSPDAKQAAYVWYGTKDGGLRVTSIDGKNTRVVSKDPSLDIAYAWSPDGNLISVNLYQNGVSRIALVSTKTGAVTPMRSTEWRKAAGVHFSPDGRFLVYSLQASPSADEADEDGAASDVFVMSVDGTMNTKIAEGSTPIWTVDGRAVVFVSRRSGTSDLWRVAVDRGRPVAESSERLEANVGAASLWRFTRDGSLFYGVNDARRDVLTATLDRTSLAAQKPAPVTDLFVGSNAGASWSRDGRTLAFFRGNDTRAVRLVLRDMTTGRERTLSTSFEDGRNARQWGAIWFPDGMSLLTQDATNNRRVFKRIDVSTGRAETIFDPPFATTTHRFALSPDGRYLYYVKRHINDPKPASELTVTRREIATGQELDLYRTPSGPGPARHKLVLSPSGDRLAFTPLIDRETLVLLLPTNGGAPVTLYRAPSRQVPFVQSWTADGRFLLGIKPESDGERVWAIPTDGGAPRALELTARQINSLDSSPLDGRIALSVFRPNSELWVIHNLSNRVTAGR